MKKILFIMTALIAINAFAGENKQCPRICPAHEPDPCCIYPPASK